VPTLWLRRLLEQNPRLVLTDFLQPTPEPTSEIVRINLECPTDATKATEVFALLSFNPVVRLLEEFPHRGRLMVTIAQVALDPIFEHSPQQATFATHPQPYGNRITELERDQIR